MGKIIGLYRNTVQIAIVQTNAGFVPVFKI